jgi:ubiquinone/menaquinone biosynthesis C-methylase UbiE
MSSITKPVHKTCVIVLGMHRSGTSALAGVLSKLGIQPGDSLLPAMVGINPKGFWEHAEVVSIHDQLLDILGSSWDDESPLPDEWWHSSLVAPLRNRIISILRRDFAALPVWLIKDPRMCRLLPMWHEVLSELACQPLFILTLRNPSEVAQSLRKRDDMSEEASCLLWLTHMLEAEFQTRGQRRAFVTYEHLLADWRETVTNIGQTLNLTWPIAIEDAAHDVEKFLDSSLRHHAASDTLPDHPTCHLAQKVFVNLCAPQPNAVQLDQLRAHSEELVNLVTPWSKRLRHSERQIRTLNGRISRLESENASLQAEIRRIKNTVSWQVTKPLRLVWNTFSRPMKSSSSSPDLSPADSVDLSCGANNEDKAHILLMNHFAPIYKEHTDSYVKGLLAIDHYRGRIEYLRAIIGAERFQQSTRVLVSGYGAGSEMLAAQQAGLGEIHGVEVEQIWLEATQKRLASMSNMYPTHYDGMRLPYPDARFDMIMSGHVIEHTRDPKLYLHECMRVLATGGHLSLEFPHRYHHTELHTRLPSLEWLPRNVRDTVLKLLSGRHSPLSAGVKERYARIMSTGLQQISMASIRDWLKSSGYRHTITDMKKAAPGVIRCVVRKDGDVSDN